MDNSSDQPPFNERRRHPRIETFNEVEYILLDQSRERVQQGTGRTLNLSRSGTLLETSHPLKGSFIILMTFDLEGNKVQVRGKVANTRQSGTPGLYLTGVKFTGSKKEHLKAITAFVQIYYRRRHSQLNNEGQDQ